MLSLLALIAMAPCQDTSFVLQRGLGVSVESLSGLIEIRAGSGDQISVQGGDVHVGRRSVAIESITSGTMRVTMPRWAALHIEAVNGDVTVHESPDVLTIEVFNGKIDVTGGAGTMQIEALNGPVMVRNFAGKRLDIEAVTGGVTVIGATGEVFIETVNQGIQLARVNSARVSATSTNGGIHWSGALNPDGRYTFESHNGRVLMELPENVSARLLVTSFQGSFSSALTGQITGLDGNRGMGGDITATYGRGAARVNISTFNGNVVVRRLGGT